jgi:hypothetical protein
MSFEKLCRVMQLVRYLNPNKDKVSRKELEQVIIKECGYDPRTKKRVITALVKLDWIRKQKKSFLLTGRDITEDWTRT